jgi:site-specific DNA recombinase
LTHEKAVLEAQLRNLSGNETYLRKLFQQNLSLLKDLRYLYKKATTVQKHKLLRLVFDNSLSYSEDIYRTRRLNKYFLHNQVALSEKRLLFIEEKEKGDREVPSSGAGGSRTRVQTHPPKAFYMFISALLCRN